MTKAGAKSPSVQRARALASLRSSASRACSDASGPSGLRIPRMLTPIRRVKADRLIVNVPHRKRDQTADWKRDKAAGWLYAKTAITRRKNTAKATEAKPARADLAVRSESA